MPGYGQGTQISRTGSSNSNSSSSNEVLGQSGYFPQQQYMVPQPMLSRTSQAGYYYYYQPAMVQMPQQAPLPQLAPAQHLAPLPQMLRPIQPLAMSPPAQPASRSNSNTSSGPQPVPRKARRGTGDGHLANPRMITTMWEDERTLCYQVEANGVSVVRRADNDMINGTKLLNVTKMTRGRQGRDPEGRESAYRGENRVHAPQGRVDPLRASVPHRRTGEDLRPLVPVVRQGHQGSAETDDADVYSPADARCKCRGRGLGPGYRCHAK
ncbi:Phd1p KNAG_0A07150 [Huiozyma naganishii CBS 8797]|uniref:Uncharacterized protein n=1 Tax=Huiozyma naganishii (strain ATCC MYA-139 / BCRC 22969 / CBS 8797 / KCTC 17520 / NBRC 10181 / NCYC 3082 / Yp74L-3) TaxID=1071383 RepID=J7RFP7_HUIN7|nr:hypothetical protein KNAG_0A07150 [Kazachstania naganishii CBS 8797]CCK68368.1 hypothetical protein KNAG_0A07150 [Kazachstania naganishii CBS 8797]